jgi:hypothetical protein
MRHMNSAQIKYRQNLITIKYHKAVMQFTICFKFQISHAIIKISQLKKREHERYM